MKRYLSKDQESANQNLKKLVKLSNSLLKKKAGGGLSVHNAKYGNVPKYYISENVNH